MGGESIFQGATIRRASSWAIAGLLALAPPASGKKSALVVFDLIEAKVDESGVQVFNGTTAIGGNWSSILVAEINNGSDLVSCTATLVGQRVLLTAAHCVDQGTSAAREVSLRVGSTMLPFSCRMSDEYALGPQFTWALRAFEDFAICWLGSSATTMPPKFQSLRREVIDLTPLASGNPVLITGYGCTSMAVDLDRRTILVPAFNPGVFSAGDGKIDSVGAVVATTFSADAKAPALCQGDSGGPLMTGASVHDPDGDRRIRAVNSKITVVKGGLRSQYASLSSASFRRLLACWRKDHPAIPINVTGPIGDARCDAR